VYELTYVYFKIYFPDKDVRLPSTSPPYCFAARLYNNIIILLYYLVSTHVYIVPVPTIIHVIRGIISSPDKEEHSVIIYSTRLYRAYRYMSII